MGGFVYIMASKRNGTLYTGVTSDLKRRVFEHKSEIYLGFSQKYGCKLLVWYQFFDQIEDAIHRETQIKKWNRKWKLRIIEEMNPDWRDLYLDLNK
jgi:putative endonuclease